MPSEIDYRKLWEFVLGLPHHRDKYSIHGPDHWLRVERNACVLASRTGARVPVVRLFALFHDSQRENDWTDPMHGARGAELAEDLRGSQYDLSDEDFDLLHYACTWHTDERFHDDPTIGTCWDADRLDLGRAGSTPDPQYMSTEFGKEIAEYGSIFPWLELAKPHIPDPLNPHLRWQSLRSICHKSMFEE
jgi:uncharacterized protein